MFELYKLAVDPRPVMLAEKHAQVEYLYGMAADREDNCLMDGVPFTEPPRIFDRKITSNAVQTLICEVINNKDHFEAGGILDYDGDKWLCTASYVFHDGLYCRGEFHRCNYKMRWQKPDGSIVERWVVVQDASSYSSGVAGDKVLHYGSDQQMVWITCDPETVIVGRDKRFFIDYNTVTPTPYTLTRVDTTTRVVKGVGYCIWLLNESQYDDKKDNITEMLCDYIDPIAPPVAQYEITYYGQPQIRIGGRNKVFEIKEAENVVWSLNASETVKDSITVVSDGNKCYVKCKLDESLIGSTIKLIATVDSVTVDLSLKIVGGV